MPVRIGTLTSTVNVVEPGGALNEEAMEKIVALVAARLQGEQAAEEHTRRESEIPDRLSQKDDV